MMAGVLANFGRTVRLYCPYGPHFPLDAIWMVSSTSQFAAAWDGVEHDNEPLGSGRLLRYFVVEKILCV